jgi:pimeloyl-ACP methyl ester carboxylesterase
MGYRTVGEGEPLLLITGYAATMDLWDPLVIRELSSRYKVILFDNRGIGATTSTEKPFSIELFAKDATGLLDALKIPRAHVLGWSMGSFIAMEMALRHPDRVDKLMLYAGGCGWNDGEGVRAAPEVSAALTDTSGTPEERAQRLLSILFPKKWFDDHPGFVNTLPRPQTPPSLESVERQGRAIGEWKGACARLPGIVQPTLIITGTEDVVIPPGNSLLMASRIKDSWLVRIPGGHSTMYQYPRLFARCLITFLEAERK